MLNLRLLFLILLGLSFGCTWGQQLDALQAIFCSSDQFRVWQTPDVSPSSTPMSEMLEAVTTLTELPDTLVLDPASRISREMAHRAEDFAARNEILGGLDYLFLQEELSFDTTSPLEPSVSFTLPGTYPFYRDPTYEWDLVVPDEPVIPDFEECSPVPAHPVFPPLDEGCDTCIEIDDGNSPVPIQVVTVTPIIGGLSTGGGGLVGTRTVTEPLLDPREIDEFLKNSSLGIESRDWLLGIVDHTFLLLTRVSRSGFPTDTFPCTGTLLDDTTIITANHCMKFYAKVDDERVSYCDGTIETILAIHPTGQVYKVKVPENWTCDQTLDVLTLKLPTPIPFQPAPFSSKLRNAQTGENLFSINYRPRTENDEIELVMYIQADCIVKNSEDHDTRFAHVCDTKGGASGSMLYSTVDRSPVGIHVSGSSARQENYAVKLSALPEGSLPPYVASTHTVTTASW